MHLLEVDTGILWTLSGQRENARAPTVGVEPVITRASSRVNISAESANCHLLCAGSESVAVEQNGPGASGRRLEGQPRAHHVLLQEGAVQLRGVRLPDQDRGVHTQSEKPAPPPPDLISHLMLVKQEHK